MHYLKTLFLFFKEVIASPRKMGAIIPSSSQLAAEMVSHVVSDAQRVVVELGAGTGAITEMLLQSGMDARRLIVIEFSHALAKQLKLRFPTVQVVEGDAAYLSTLLNNEKRQISTIISSLPLRSLDAITTQAILKQIPQCLSKHGRYIQFTYSFTQNTLYDVPHCKKIISKWVWQNLPPARVEVWVK